MPEKYQVMKTTYRELKTENLNLRPGGKGIAIPHCKGGCVKEAAFTLVKLNQKIEWGSLDGEPVDYVIMLAAPNTADNVHLKMLSSLAVGLMGTISERH